MLIDRYHAAIDELLKTVRETQRENIIKAGEMVADTVEKGGKIYFCEVVHGIQKDLIYRGGGPIFYKEYKEGETELKEGDILFVSSVSGRTKKVVDLAWDCVQKGIKVIAFTSMTYATQVDPVHESGKKLYEFATLTLDNCAPAAEAMLEVEGIEARFAATSGIASDYILWGLTSVCVEKMLADGYTPGILKSANFPGIMKYFDMADLVAMAAPRPYVAVNGVTDASFPIDSAKQQVADARKVYAALGAEDMLRHVIGPEGHRFYKAPAWPVFEEVTGWCK